MGVFAVECLVVNSQLDDNNKIKWVNYLWMIKLPTKWNPVQGIISQNNFSTKPSTVCGKSTDIIVGNAAAEGSASHVVNHTGILLLTQTGYYDHRGTKRIWYEAQQKYKRKKKMIKCWIISLLYLLFRDFLFHICNEIFAHLCSYLVSKALLKKHTVNIWGKGQRSLL